MSLVWNETRTLHVDDAPSMEGKETLDALMKLDLSAGVDVQIKT